MDGGEGLISSNAMSEFEPGFGGVISMEWARKGAIQGTSVDTNFAINEGRGEEGVFGLTVERVD